MNSIQNLNQFRKLSFSALALVIVLIVLSTLSSRFITKAHTQAQHLNEYTIEQRLVLDKISSKSFTLITEMNYSIADKNKIIATQHSIKNDLNDLKLIHNKIHHEGDNTAFIFNKGIQEQILKIVDLNVKVFIEGIEALTSNKADTLEGQLYLWTAINIASSASGAMIHSLNHFTVFIQDEIKKITSTLEIIYTGLNLTILIIIIMLGKFLLYPSIRNIEQSLQYEQQQTLLLEHMANTDRLTGVGNRQKMDTFIEQYNEDKLSVKMALLLLDLNKFKPVNDTYGHKAGDALLVHISKQLQSLEDNNTSLYRVGGDEFCIIKCGCFTDDALEALAKKVIILIEQPLDFQGRSFCVGASIGVASASNNNLNFDTLMVNADRAMYWAKAVHHTKPEQRSAYQLYSNDNNERTD